MATNKRLARRLGVAVAAAAGIAGCGADDANLSTTPGPGTAPGSTAGAKPTPNFAVTCKDEIRQQFVTGEKFVAAGGTAAAVRPDPSPPRGTRPAAPSLAAMLGGARLVYGTATSEITAVGRVTILKPLAAFPPTTGTGFYLHTDSRLVVASDGTARWKDSDGVESIVPDGVPVVAAVTGALNPDPRTEFEHLAIQYGSVHLVAGGVIQTNNTSSDPYMANRSPQVLFAEAAAISKQQDPAFPEMEDRQFLASCPDAGPYFANSEGFEMTLPIGRGRVTRPTPSTTPGGGLAVAG